jgi:hypothetical protein
LREEEWMDDTQNRCVEVVDDLQQSDRNGNVEL